MTDDPREPADEPAQLSPEDDAAVHDLLASLPDPEVPADVVARVNAALAAEAARTDVPGAESNVSVLIARDPDDGSRSGSERRGGRSTRILQVAAGVAVLAVAAGIAVSVASNHGSGSGSNGATSASGPGSAPVTVSRTAYDAKNLDQGIQALAANAPAEAAAAGATPATTAAVTGLGAAGLPTVAASVSLAAVTSLVRDPARRAACVAALAGSTDIAPVAIDVGTYDKKPAIVVVLPDADDPAVLDGWVVGPSCSDANTIPYTYHHVPRP